MGAKWTVNCFEKLFKPVFCCLTGLHRNHYTVANLNADHKNNKQNVPGHHKKLALFSCSPKIAYLSITMIPVSTVNPL